MAEIVPWCDESLAALRDDPTGKSQHIRCSVVRSVIDEALIYRKANAFAIADGRYVFVRAVDHLNRTSRASFLLRSESGSQVEVARYTRELVGEGWSARTMEGLDSTPERLGPFGCEVAAMDALWRRLPHEVGTTGSIRP